MKNRAWSGFFLFRCHRITTTFVIFARSFRIRYITKNYEHEIVCTDSKCTELQSYLSDFFWLSFRWEVRSFVRCALTSWNRPKTIKNRIKSTKITHAESAQLHHVNRKMEQDHGNNEEETTTNEWIHRARKKRHTHTCVRANAKRLYAKKRKYGEQLHLWHMVILPSSINIHFTRALAPIIRLQIWFIKKNYHHFVCSSWSLSSSSSMPNIRRNVYKFYIKWTGTDLCSFGIIFCGLLLLELSWSLLPYYLFTLNEFDVVYDVSMQEIEWEWNRCELSKERMITAQLEFIGRCDKMKGIKSWW